MSTPAMEADGVLVPDGVEPIAGYRAWLLDGPDRMPGCLSSFNGTIWGAPVVRAYCRARRSASSVAQHLAPSAGCSCGLYALKPEPEALRFLELELGPGVVVGSVRLWGKVIEGAHGYRAEFARVATLVPLTQRDAVACREAADRCGATYRGYLVGITAPGAPYSYLVQTQWAELWRRLDLLPPVPQHPDLESP